MKIENKKAYIPCEIIENQINNGLDIRVRIDKTHDLYINRKLLIPDIDQPKPEVPQCVFDMIKEYKEEGNSLYVAIYDADCFEKVQYWIDSQENGYDQFARAWIAYPNIAVEKEKLYTVEIPNPHEKQLSYVLMRKPGGNISINVVHSSNLDLLKTDNDLQLTEQEIRKDFDWAWQWKKEVTE
ncbi:DUF1642 domain-containing protein [Streptococcus uberis]|uniref:DUF1642 domain-containing protein n=1 Tax=Streptococcus uberis TaxID=1349 RepID=UPI002FED1A2D